MNIALISLLLVGLLFSVYGWLSTIECSVAIIRLFPSLSDDAKASTGLFTPIWEVTNVFLVFGFTGFAFLFNNGIVTISKAVLSVLIVGLMALVIRACTVLYLFYHQNIMGRHWLNVLFLLTSFTVPLSFGAAGVFLLTGNTFWQTATGGAAFAALACGLLSLALAFIFWQNRKPSRQLRILSLLSNVALSIITSVVLVGLMNRYLPQLYNMAFIYFILLVNFIIIIQAFLVLTKMEKYMWWYLSAVAILTPPTLLLANRPYLAYPTVTIDQAYGAQAFGTAALVGLGVIFPVIAIGLGLLYSLLPRRPRRGIK